MADTTGMIPLWIIGTVTGIDVIMVPIQDWVHPCSNQMN